MLLVQIAVAYGKLIRIFEPVYQEGEPCKHVSVFYKWVTGEFKRSFSWRNLDKVSFRNWTTDGTRPSRLQWTFLLVPSCGILKVIDCLFVVVIGYYFINIGTLPLYAVMVRNRVGVPLCSASLKRFAQILTYFNFLELQRNFLSSVKKRLFFF